MRIAIDSACGRYTVTADWSLWPALLTRKGEDFMSNDMAHGARVGDPAFFAAVRGRAGEIANDLKKEVKFPSESGYNHLVEKVKLLKVTIKEVYGESAKHCSSEHQRSLYCEIWRMTQGRVLILNAMLGYDKALNVYGIALIDGEKKDIRAYDDEEMQVDAVRYVACTQALLEAAQARKSPVLNQVFEAA